MVRTRQVQVLADKAPGYMYLYSKDLSLSVCWFDAQPLQCLVSYHEETVSREWGNTVGSVHLGKTSVLVLPSSSGEIQSKHCWWWSDDNEWRRYGVQVCCMWMVHRPPMWTSTVAKATRLPSRKKVSCSYTGPCTRAGVVAWYFTMCIAFETGQRQLGFARVELSAASQFCLVLCNQSTQLWWSGLGQQHSSFCPRVLVSFLSLSCCFPQLCLGAVVSSWLCIVTPSQHPISEVTHLHCWT